MNAGVALIIVIIFFIGLELMARVHYYGRMKGYRIIERIKLVFLGKWLISDAFFSPLYIREIAANLDVSEEFMIKVLSESSGKTKDEIQRIFLDKTGRIEKHSFSPTLGFLPAPSQNLGYLTTNAEGFRGTTIRMKKPPHVKRVLLLGGSVAFGRTATSDDITISAQLEKNLNKNRQPDQRIQWQVINLGVPDYISFQELVLLVKKGLQYDPDIVISLSGFNDAHHYLNTGTVNEPTSLRSVRQVYNAFFGSLPQRIFLWLESFLVTVFYIRILTRPASVADNAEISPFIYTIW